MFWFEQPTGDTIQLHVFYYAATFFVMQASSVYDPVTVLGWFPGAHAGEESSSKPLLSKIGYYGGPPAHRQVLIFWMGLRSYSEVLFIYSHAPHFHLSPKNHVGHQHMRQSVANICNYNAISIKNSVFWKPVLMFECTFRGLCWRLSCHSKLAQHLLPQARLSSKISGTITADRQNWTKIATVPLGSCPNPLNQHSGYSSRDPHSAQVWFG